MDWRVARIREIDCIGCARCLPACPVDAIVGASRYMHTVIVDECIGCGLCVSPCPVDCIEMHPAPMPPSETRRVKARVARTRISARKHRLQRSDDSFISVDLQKRQLEIADILARAC